MPNSESNRQSSMSDDVTLKSLQSMESSDRENIILKIDEVESPVDERTQQQQSSIGNNNNNNNNNNNYCSSGNTLSVRRARLKSISLDSDGARLVGENLTRPVEEIVEMTTYMPSDDMTNDDDDDDDASMTSANNNNDRVNPKNIFNLTINLNSRDSSLDTHPTTSSDVNMNNPSADDDVYDDDEGGEVDEICRTPTMKYFAGKKVRFC